MLPAEASTDLMTDRERRTTRQGEKQEKKKKKNPPMTIGENEKSFLQLSLLATYRSARYEKIRPTPAVNLSGCFLPLSRL